MRRLSDLCYGAGGMKIHVRSDLKKGNETEREMQGLLVPEEAETGLLHEEHEETAETASEREVNGKTGSN